MHIRFLTVIVALSFSVAADASEEEPGADSPTTTPHVEEIVVWGVRGGKLDSVPGAATNVIFTDDYTAENKTLGDVLSDTEGISVRSFGAAGDRSEVSIRGSSPSQVVVTIDGVRANSMLTGGLDLSRVCLPLLDRVEITRGAGSTMEGSGAIGGVVNVATRGANSVGSSTRMAFNGGSFGTLEGSVLRSDRIGVVDYTVGYCGFETDGDFEFARPTEKIGGVEARFEPDTATRINNDRVQHGGTVALGVPLSGGTLRLTDYAVYSSGGEPGTDSGNGSIAGQATDAHSRDLSNLAHLRWEGPGLGGELDAVLYHRFESERFRDAAVVFRSPIDVKVRLSTAGARLSDEWKGEYLGQSHETRLQVDFAHDVLRGNDASGRDRPRAAGAITETLRFLDETITFSAGARVDWTDGFDAKVLPSFGFVISPFSWVRLRSQVGRAYRAPNFDELFHPDEGFIRGNPDLSPEDAWNFDVGLELKLDKAGPFSNLEFRASWFRREIDESIVWVLVNPRTLAPINTGGATTSGYEVAASFELTRFLSVSANHTQTNSRRDATGESLPGQSSEETSARIQLGPRDQWKLVGEVQRVGKILVNEGGSRILPARTVWNSSASVNLAEVPWFRLDRLVTEFWVFAQVSNLTDVAIRDSISFPQPGRNATAGFEAVW